MIVELISNFIAKRLVRWGVIAGINAIGIISVAGIPVVLIIDVLLIFYAIKGTVNKVGVVAQTTGTVALNGAIILQNGGASFIYGILRLVKGFFYLILGLFVLGTLAIVLIPLFEK